jgi:glycosyltransferase involved in cell wall biosynthesis
VIGRALLLSPSAGLGGGIERYVETLQWAFTTQGVEHARVDLHHGDRRRRASAHVGMLAQCRRHLQTNEAPTRLVVAHRALLPLASLLMRERSVCGISVICHGTDVWGDRPRLRQSIESCLMRRPDVRVVAVSSFTAGALSGDRPVTILPPGLSRDWFHTLVESSSRAQKRGLGVSLVTAFRLADWRGKGLPQLLRAVAALDRTDVRVNVCGSGQPPRELRLMVREYPFCSLLPGLADRELARELAEADLFVLATRTRAGRDASGEGFGLVLLEAQVAGTPVVAPASGGSHDAYVDQITGVAPTEETAESLSETLGGLLRDPCQLAQMGRRAAEWAREVFEPEHYASQAAARLL